MSKLAASRSRAYLDTYNLSGYITNWTLTADQEVIGADGLSSTGPEVVLGNYGHGASIATLADFDEDEIDQLINEALDDDLHYLLELMSVAENSIGYEQIVKVQGDPKTAAVGAAHLLAITFAGAGGLARSTLLRSATVTADGDGTGRNLGATVAGDVFQVVYRVLSGTFTSFTLETWQSTDDAAADPYAEIAALNSGSITAAGVTRKTTTGATEAWKRISVDDWIGTNAVILVTAGTVVD